MAQLLMCCGILAAVRGETRIFEWRISASHIVFERRIGGFDLGDLAQSVAAQTVCAKGR